MRKVIFLICTSSFFIIPVCCQDTTKINLGFEAAPTITYILGLQDSNTHFGVMPSYTVGIHFQYNFNSRFSFRTGIQYDVKGIEERLLVLSQPDTYTLPDSLTEHRAYNQLQYIQIPAMARFSFGKKVLFNIDAGMYIGILLEAFNTKPGIIIDGLGGIKDYDEKYYFKKSLLDNFNRLDIGGIFGVGISYDVHPKLRISFSVRENLGFYHIGRYVSNSNYYLANSSTQFLVGFSWNFYAKKKVPAKSE